MIGVLSKYTSRAPNTIVSPSSDTFCEKALSPTDVGILQSRGTSNTPVWKADFADVDLASTCKFVLPIRSILSRGKRRVRRTAPKLSVMPVVSMESLSFTVTPIPGTGLAVIQGDGRGQGQKFNY